MPGVGIPPTEANLPPIIKRNYGQWVWHDVPRPGVLRHVAESGEECYTVRAGMPSNARVSTELARTICNLADRYTEGYLRITRRHSLELVGVKPEEIDEVIQKLAALGLPVGARTAACTTWWPAPAGSTASLRPPAQQPSLRPFPIRCTTCSWRRSYRPS